MFDGAGGVFGDWSLVGEQGLDRGGLTVRTLLCVGVGNGCLTLFLCLLSSCTLWFVDCGRGAALSVCVMFDGDRICVNARTRLTRNAWTSAAIGGQGYI